MNFQTPNLNILYYPAGAGGKFISNCLALSKGAVSQNPHSTLVELEQGRGDFYNFLAGSSWPTFDEFLEGADHPELSSYNIGQYHHYSALYRTVPYYDFKLQVVLGSLPSSQDEVKHWLKYEYGCSQQFGFDMTRQAAHLSKFSYVSRLLLESSVKYFVVAHNLSSLQHIITSFPNANVIQLVNYSKFRIIAQSVKQLPKLREILPRASSIQFDIDSSIFDITTFVPAVKELYQKLGLVDFDQRRIEQFYTAYMELHLLS